MLKKLKNLFVVEEENSQGKVPSSASPQTEETTKQTPTADTSPQNPTKPHIVTAPDPGAKPDEKFITKLLGAIENANMQGFDYLEFKQALQNLSSVSMDEHTRYQSAVAMAKTMGSDSNKLISSAQHYLSVIAEEEQKFKSAYDNQTKVKLQERSQNLQSLKDGIELRKKKIEELQAEIAKMEKDLDNFETRSDQEAAKFNETKNGFYAAYHAIAQQIKDDIGKIQKAG